MTVLIDLRSDTVTLPTREMLGKEAGLFVTSGTMGNLVALLAHAPRGTKVILGDEAHIFQFEQGGASVVGGLVYHTIPTNPYGDLPTERLRQALQRHDDAHFAPPGVLCLENTHNRRGGTVLPLDYLVEVRQLADEHAVPLHLDGARLPNAAVALGVSLREAAAPFASVQLDLSKGLAAPVGGIVVGSREFIKQAHRARKLLGGGMRQAGVIAAAGIVALEQMVERLAEDHQHARLLAEGLAELPDVALDLSTVQTNLIVFRLNPVRWKPAAFISTMREQGILLGRSGYDQLRFATHYGISRADIDRTLVACKQVLAPLY